VANQYGKHAPKIGTAPAIVLINPKFAHNVGAAVRAASCFGVEQVWYTGDRIDVSGKKRLPREERIASSGEDVETRTAALKRVWDKAEKHYQKGAVKYVNSI
jgi:tRNA(Leu) C34 or U34 (ribose-2'-O)-methylase TrmL